MATTGEKEAAHGHVRHSARTKTPAEADVRLLILKTKMIAPRNMIENRTFLCLMKIAVFCVFMD